MSTTSDDIALRLEVLRLANTYSANTTTVESLLATANRLYLWVNTGDSAPAPAAPAAGTSANATA